MNDDELKALLNRDHNAQVPEQAKPSEQAKQKAIELALKEFDGAAPLKETWSKSFFQGILSWMRLTGETRQNREENPMYKPTQPWMLGGATAAVVGLFAFTLVNFDSHKRPLTLPSQQQVPLNIPANETLKKAESADVTAKDAIPEAELDVAQSTTVSPAPVTSHMAMEMKRERSPTAKLSSQLSRQLSIAPAGDYSALYQPPAQNRDKFESFDINGIQLVSENPVSTFSVDVDTASYSFVRRALNQGRMPPKDAVRIEEMINYFDYQYPNADSKMVPFSTTVNVLPSPWNEGNKLVHIGLRAYDIEADKQPKTNLVFLLDVSGSMNSADKLPLVKQSMNLLLDRLNPEDTVAIAVYAGAAGTVLEPTPAKEKSTILAALNRLNAGGSTAGAQGIELAYALAEANFDKNAVNRIILATDGDFNVGMTNMDELQGFVERKRDAGVYLSVLGFGRGNYNDQLMQTLAQNGNGVAAYIDTLSEAQKVLVQEASASLFSVAKDVKIQVEFNPATVSEYRLIGYETRALNKEDFNNDKVDAGDIGSGHKVTAIYEITPVNSGSGLIDDSRYAQKTDSEKTNAQNRPLNEYGYLKLRYKLPESTRSNLIETPVVARDTIGGATALMQQEVQFAVAVAGFSQLLKDDKFLDDWRLDDALELALKNRGDDPYGYRSEFVQLIRKAQTAKN